MTKRSPERTEYLAYLLSTAIEHCGYGFPGVIDYHCPDDNYAEWHAVIYDRYEDAEKEEPSQTWRVDLDTMAKGLGIVRADKEAKADWVNDLKLSDRTNGDDGDYDVVGALLVLESAIFGKGTYS
jgi:hypothetical protein